MRATGAAGVAAFIAGAGLDGAMGFFGSTDDCGEAGVAGFGDDCTGLANGCFGGGCGARAPPPDADLSGGNGFFSPGALFSVGFVGEAMFWSSAMSNHSQGLLTRQPE